MKFQLKILAGYFVLVGSHAQGTPMDSFARNGKYIRDGGWQALESSLSVLYASQRSAASVSALRATAAPVGESTLSDGAPLLRSSDTQEVGPNSIASETTITLSPVTPELPQASSNALTISLPFEQETVPATETQTTATSLSFSDPPFSEIPSSAVQINSKPGASSITLSSASIETVQESFGYYNTVPIFTTICAFILSYFH
ncbi:uncharacterized protein PRCAT00005039001 [Priceomyces carsonii]|uniref:uncharacterized protein n=1 Tax=Priceomyces carsonii TaxID=28549 RepID=UPI002EDA1ED5|nr:unnamed protein product [Priceomyces carsonii]